MDILIIDDKLNEALNTLDLRLPKAIKMLKRADNIRNRLLKDNENYLLQYELIQQCYRIANEFNNEAMASLYNELIGKSDFARKKTFSEWFKKEENEILFYTICAVVPVVIINLWLLFINVIG